MSWQTAFSKIPFARLERFWGLILKPRILNERIGLMTGDGRKWMCFADSGAEQAC
jgi:hypothetical protein